MAISTAAGVRIYQGALTHTDMTTEACAQVTTTRFQVTDHAKRYLDQTHAFTVYSNGTPVAASGYTLEYPGGFIVFTSSHAGETITISGGYFAITKTYRVTDVEYAMSVDHVDVTEVGDTAVRNYPTTGPHASVTLKGLHEDNTQFAKMGGRYILVFSESGTYDTDHIDTGRRYESYARLQDNKIPTPAGDVLRDDLTFVSDGPVYIRSD